MTLKQEEQVFDELVRVRKALQTIADELHGLLVLKVGDLWSKGQFGKKRKSEIVREDELHLKWDKLFKELQ